MKENKSFSNLPNSNWEFKLDTLEEIDKFLEIYNPTKCITKKEKIGIGQLLTTKLSSHGQRNQNSQNNFEKEQADRLTQSVFKTYHKATVINEI